MTKRLCTILSLLLTVLLLAQPAFFARAADGIPVRAESDPAEPVKPEPTETEPIETEPVVTEPVGTEPVETEPVETEPVETEPVETEPVETEPVEPEPPEPEYPVLAEHPAYIHGDNNGAFRPNSGLSRAELAQILYNVCAPAGGAADSFPDVAPEAWYAPAVNALAEAGLLEGYPDGTFRPDRAVSRAELVTVLRRLLEEVQTPEQEASTVFSDVPASHWACADISLALALGWVDGYPDGTFRPDRAVTRAEAVTLLNRFWDRVPDREAIDADPELRFFPDVPRDQWFYYDVMEAAAGHTASYDGAETPERWLEAEHESAGLEDGFRCVEGRLYLVLEGDFLRTEQEGCFADVLYTCQGESGVCTAQGPSLLLYDDRLILLTEEGSPLYGPGSYPTGFFFRDGGIYAAKGGLLIQTAGSGSLSGYAYVCEGLWGRCTVEGHVLPTVPGPWYRLSEGTVDLAPGLYSYTSGMYCVQDDGTLLQNGSFHGLSFGANGKYTSGNSRIDAEIDRIVGLYTDDSMTGEEKLFGCYQYVFSTALRYRANNNHVPKGQDCSLWAETYMIRLLDQNGWGNCYCFAAEYYYLCRRVGYWQARAVSGAVFSKNYDHGWVEIELDGVRYLFDPRTDARYFKNPGALYKKTYSEAPYTYYPPD